MQKMKQKYKQNPPHHQLSQAPSPKPAGAPTLRILNDATAEHINGKHQAIQVQ